MSVGNFRCRNFSLGTTHDLNVDKFVNKRVKFHGDGLAVFGLCFGCVPCHERHVLHTKIVGKVTGFHFELAFPCDKRGERCCDGGVAVADVESDR